MVDHRRVLKRLDKKCRECGGVLELISYDIDDKGVIYTEQYVECIECLDREKVKLPEKRIMGDSWKSGIPTKF